MLLPHDGYCGSLSMFSLGLSMHQTPMTAVDVRMRLLVYVQTADDAGITRKQQTMATQCGYTSACSLHQVNRLHSGTANVPG